MAIFTPQDFLDATKKRRTIYKITDNDLPLQHSEIESIVRQALVDCPSPWNVSSSRAIIIFDKEHKRVFNDVVHATLRTTMTEERHALFLKFVEGFAAGAGSVFFFEDQDALKELEEAHPTSKDAIPEWSDASNGMAQFIVWTALSTAGLGCSLQHLSFLPLVEDAIRKDLQIPASWTPKAQLVFGRPTERPGERPPPSANIGERVQVRI